MSHLINRIGHRYGKLTVVEYSGYKPRKGTRWRCKCDCGGEATIASTSLTTGNTKSCGCLLVESRRQKSLPGRKTRIYELWMNIKQRCDNPNHPKYQYYGGRGIKVCERWRRFENFLQDIVEIPKGLTLDRKDNDGDYEPSNVRLASRKQQTRNRRITVTLTHNGETKPLAEWAEIMGVTRWCLVDRLKRGWSVAKTLGHIPPLLAQPKST